MESRDPPIIICYWLLFPRRETSRAGDGSRFAPPPASWWHFFSIARFTLPPRHTSIIFTQKPVYPRRFPSKNALFHSAAHLGVFLREILWPRDLCADYTAFSVRHFTFVPCVVALIALVAAQAFIGYYAPVRARRRDLLARPDPGFQLRADLSPDGGSFPLLPDGGSCGDAGIHSCRKPALLKVFATGGIIASCFLAAATFNAKKYGTTACRSGVMRPGEIRSRGIH